MQKDNNGIVMVNFYSDFINCTDPAAATVGQVAGKLLLTLLMHDLMLCNDYNHEC